MKLIVSIGNPGVAYANTRHNAGFLVAEALQNSKLLKDVVIRKSDTFMNESGIFVKKLVNNYKLDLNDLYVIHDDLDIKLGEYKIQFGRGPKDHNGLKSIDEELGTDQYWHVRIGVDNRPLDGRVMGEEYVLQNFSDGEKQILERATKETVNDILNSLRAL